MFKFFNQYFYACVLVFPFGTVILHDSQAGSFDENRARFYAAQILLGLEHIHSKDIILRELGLENILLDKNGNCKISISPTSLSTNSRKYSHRETLDWNIVRLIWIAFYNNTTSQSYFSRLPKDIIKHLISFIGRMANDNPFLTSLSYAGIPGYVAPEIILLYNRPIRYDYRADYFSFGVLIYRLLCGKKPFEFKNLRHRNRTRRTQILDRNCIEGEPEFEIAKFDFVAKSLIKGLLCKNLENRLGSSDNGINDIKQHPWFDSIDFEWIEHGYSYIKAPFIPDANEIYNKIKQGDHSNKKYPNIEDLDMNKYNEYYEDEKLKHFGFIRKGLFEEEMVHVFNCEYGNVDTVRIEQTQKECDNSNHENTETQPTSGSKFCSILICKPKFEGL